MNETPINPLDQFLESQEADDPFADFTSATGEPEIAPQKQELQKSLEAESVSSPPQKTTSSEQSTSQNNPTVEGTHKGSAVQQSLTDDAPDPFAVALAQAKVQSDERLVSAIAEREAVFAYCRKRQGGRA